MLADFPRYGEAVGMGPLQLLPRKRYFIIAEGRAVDAPGASLVGASVPDNGMADYQRWLVCLGPGFGNCRGHGVQVAPVHCAQHLPAVGLETAGNVLQESDVGVALNGDLVVVVYDDEFTQAQSSSQGSGFGSNAFLEVAVRCQSIGIVVNDFVAGAVEAGCQPTLGQGHAHGVG